MIPLDQHPSGRHFLQIPGPSPVPDRVLRAMSLPTIDHRGPEFGQLGLKVLAGMQQIFRTKHPVAIYPASGTGAWEAALVNTLSPGDAVLMFETGHFATLWKKLAERLGLKPEFLAVPGTDAATGLPWGWRRGVQAELIEQRLRADAGHAIKAVCVVHNETSTGVTSDIAAVRRAIDAAGHPALLLVDSISGLACADYRHDEWGVDVTISGSQKGLMLPTGMSFTAVSEKAFAAHQHARLPRFYFDWTMMSKRAHRSFIGTIPTSVFYGLRESIRLLEEEGLDNVIARHTRLAEATRRAVQTWASANDGPQFFCSNPERYSNSVTTVLMPEGRSSDPLRKTIRERFNVSLGGGLTKLSGRVFRIGHLGDLNEPMLLGTLGAVEMGLRIEGIPHGRGGVDAAMAYLVGD